MRRARLPRLTKPRHDGADIALEFDGANALAARMSHGDRVDEPLVMARDEDASGTLDADEAFFTHADRLGSIRLLSDASGAVVSDAAYDAYGRRVSGFEAIAGPYAYTARERDPETGLTCYRARYYDPETGR